MTVPALVFGIFISTFYGVLFHLWKDGGLGRLLLYIVLSWMGFMFGHWIGGRMGWSFVEVGPLHLGWATIGSVIFLGVGHWLSLIQAERQP